MYESFFGLNKKPFQITTDPSFLWMGRKHRDALSTLKYGVIENKGFLMLTGDVGTGKTTLINRLVGDIKDRAYTAKIPDPGLSKYDFYRMVAQYFGMPIQVRTKNDFIEPFSRFLNDAHEEKKSVLLLIDEAQRLKQDLMEEIRLLSDLEHQEDKLLNIFFVGQNELNGILLRPENRALMRRITITYNLDPLDSGETCEYIRHRLKTAGAGHEIFSSAAMEEVFAFSNGYPRQINIICDLAMFFAAQLSQRTIKNDVVRQCRERLSFTVPTPSVESESNIREAAPAKPYRPPNAMRPAWCGSLGRLALILIMMIIVGVALYVVVPSGWKERGSQWFHGIFGQGRQVFDANLGTHSPLDAADHDIPPTAYTLHQPSPPPKLGMAANSTADLATAGKPQPVLDGSQEPSPPGTAIGKKSDGTRPNPADAIDWLLEKRRRESGD